MYKAGLESGLWIALLLLLVNAIMVALALALVIKPFLQKPAESVVSKPVERDIGLWVPPMLLAFASLLLPLFGLNWVNTHLISRVHLQSAPQRHLSSLNCGKALIYRFY
ncbi:Na(+) H(+) antiporter subunit A [Vibrio ishigakensis]|uniref:Na(+) H(+) antiporter subunit A n=1 Tax=Vibrio ishigakensis TaxID=1481914 RepID=A0A0B8P5M6_9VIBR|nr:Na(+) H(+) antiporter subunit A [Vibrio ishigakensis]